MTITVEKVELEAILPLRALFLSEANRQVRHNARHERGWSDSYLVVIDGQKVGYGSIMGREIKDRDTVFESFVIPSFRKRASNLFRSTDCRRKADFHRVPEQRPVPFSDAFRIRTQHFCRRGSF